jgi:hypothetical protein
MQEMLNSQKTELQNEAPNVEDNDSLSVQSPALESTNVEQELNEMSDSDLEEIVSEEDVVNYSDMTDGQLVEEAKGLMRSNPQSYASLKSRMDAIKHTFYKRLNAKNEELFQKFIEEGGKKEDFTAPVNPLEEELREELQRYKEKRASEITRLENERKANLAAKQKVLEDMKALLVSDEDFSAVVPKFKALQQAWKEIGVVPASELNTLWKSYQHCNESFYDSVKINNELRDYDFRKNLEMKTALCEQAEALADAKDIVAAFRKLQALHEEWKEIGPVAKDVREEVWNRFKNASTVINKRHHEHFDQLRASEMENLEKKKAICETLESIDLTSFDSYKEWQDKTEEVLKLQADWKSIGFAPKKDNVAIFERFRSACDNFFKAKNVYFKSTKEQLVANLNKKIELCEKAEALKDSEDWKKTTDVLVQLQKEWKTVGAVPKKHSETLWKRFVTACDEFFNRKNNELSGQRKEQDENLAKKKEIIEKIKTLAIGDDSEKSYNELKSLIAEWNAVGHVPFKDKDKVYKKYKEAIDRQFDKLKVEHASRKFEAFKSNMKDMSDKEKKQVLFDERRRLLRKYETLNSEISTYERNMSFFASSKNANSLIKEYEAKVAKLKSERDLVFKQIRKIEAEANN